MILINPPVSKPCEPPLGIARLAGALETEHIPYTIVDANLEGLCYLLSRDIAVTDTWTKRAVKNLKRDLDATKTWSLYADRNRYGTAIGNINRILYAASKAHNQFVSLSDFEHSSWKPVRSPDLRAAFETPEDNIFYPYFSKRLGELLLEFPSFAIGFSLSFLHQAICTFSMAGYIKKIAPHSILTLGGSLVSSWSNRTEFLDLCRGVFDHVVSGPGEATVVSLCKRGPAVSEHYMPSFDKLRLRDYIAPSPILPYNTSLGCYWNKCTFCPENTEQNKYVPIRHSVACDEIALLTARYKPGLIHFTDSALSPSFLGAYATRHADIPWYGFARIDETLSDADFVRNLKESGCVMLELGIESGNDRVLESINKGGSVSLAHRVLESVKRGGIATYVYLLFGTPLEDEESAHDTLRFVASHSEQIDFLNVSIFNMPAKGKDALLYPSQLFYSGDLTLYADFIHPKGWGRKAIRNFLDSEFRNHKAIAPIMKRRPPSFTSNHAPFFVLAALKGRPDSTS